MGRHEKREADNGFDRPSGRHEKREADNGHDSVKNQKRKKRALVCDNCGGKGHPARLCPTPLDHAAQAVHEEGDTEEESSMVQVTKTVTSWEWDVSPQNKASESAAQLWWTGEAENVLPAGVCNYVKLSATRRSDAGIGFRGAGGERIRNHGRGSSRFE